MNYFDIYKKRTLGNATTMKQKIIDDGRRSFEQYLRTSPTAMEVTYTKPDEFPNLETNEKKLMAINDKTDNDKKAYDEKKLMCTLDTDIEVGSYVFWQQTWWLVIFKEYKPMDTYKRLTMTKCNELYNYNYKGKVYKIPMVVAALTLYGDGLADIRHTSYGDSKNRIHFGSNPITRTIDVGTRIMLTGKTTYRVTNLTDFEYNGKSIGSPGLCSALVLQTTMLGEDDVENNIAYNPISKVEDETVVNKILGKTEIYLGEQNKYSINYDKEVEFSLDFAYANVEIVNQGNNECVLRHNMEMNDIGITVMLIAKDKETKETLDTKNILIRGM